jgi:glycosyltransferase involved in cell wall biosynthesis
MPGEIPKTLFVAWGTSGVAYYRCFLPALVLGAEYVASNGEPGKDLVLGTGFGARVLQVEDFYDYEVVVLQQPRGVGWLQQIRDLQAAGITVLYEIDDYVQSARKTKSHELAKVYDEKFVERMELTMRVCDGVICSTPYLARRYRAFNDRTWVCQNGIDLKRYGWPRPPRQGVTIGWAGGIGHKASLARWEPAIRAVLRARPEARFVSVGHRFADELVPEFGPERALAVPGSQLEVYPASMTLFDIAIAPSAENNLFRGKSDLRWLEASALGVPLVAHPDVYPEIEDGVTGVHARTPADVEAALLRLIDDTAERERIGATAHEHVAAHRSAEVTAEQWRAVFAEAVAGARA